MNDLKKDLKKMKNKIIDIINCFILTKNVYLISLCLLLVILSWLFYFYSYFYYSELSLVHLENEKFIFSIICWLFNCCVLIILWNVYAFFYLNVFQYRYNQHKGEVMLTLTEDLYKNPMSSVIMIYFLQKSFFSNSIDNSFWFLIIMNYYFLVFHIIQFFQIFDYELNNFKKLEEKIKKNFMRKINFVCAFFFSCNFIFTCFVILFVNSNEKGYRYIFIGKGIYIAIKIIELYTTRKKKFYFYIHDTPTKEKNFVWNLKLKLYLEMTTMVFVYFQLFILLKFDEGKFIFFSYGMFLILLHQFYKGIIYYRKYEYMKECFRNLNSALKKKVSLDDYCVICSEKLGDARVLSCNHCFHLICLGKWFLKGYKTCPVCKKDINVDENPNGIIHPTRNQRREVTFDIGSSNILFGMLPTLRVRIVRNINNEEGDETTNNNLVILSEF